LDNIVPKPTYTAWRSQAECGANLIKRTHDNDKENHTRQR